MAEWTSRGCVAPANETKKDIHMDHGWSNMISLCHYFCSEHGNVALDLNEFYLDWLPLNKIPGSPAACRSTCYRAVGLF